MRHTTIIFFLLFPISLMAQEQEGKALSFSEEKYDQSYISPSLRGKHSISLGLLNVQTTPDQNLVANQSLQIGYNFLILKERKLILALKDKYRTEMNSIGLHFTLVNPHEHYLMGTFFSSFLAKKGRFISFYFLSEVGLGYHYKKNLQSFNQNRFNMSLLLEFIRFRVGKIPMYLNISGTYALTNNLFNKTPIILGYMVGLRYYFYRK